jgi:hypothetical protein
LLPGPVKFTDSGNGSYRLEGERLRAVDKVRLEREGDVILVDPRVGYNDVNFSLPAPERKAISDAEKQAADAAKKAGENPKPVGKKYSVFVMIKGVTLPVYQLNGKQLEQVTFTYPKSKEDDTVKSKPDQSTASDQTNVQLKMNIDVSTDAKGTETKGSKNAGTGSGTASVTKPKAAASVPSSTVTPPAKAGPTPTEMAKGSGTAGTANKSEKKGVKNGGLKQ